MLVVINIRKGTRISTSGIKERVNTPERTELEEGPMKIIGIEALVVDSGDVNGNYNRDL
jgi:hypothetical protein